MCYFGQGKTDFVLGGGHDGTDGIFRRNLNYSGFMWEHVGTHAKQIGSIEH